MIMIQNIYRCIHKNFRTKKKRFSFKRLDTRRSILIELILLFCVIRYVPRELLFENIVGSMWVVGLFAIYVTSDLKSSQLHDNFNKNVDNRNARRSCC